MSILASIILEQSEWEALLLSLRVGVASTIVSLVPGVAVAWLLARKEFPGRILLDAVVHLPLVLPPVVVGYGLLLLLGRNGPVGGWLREWTGVSIAFTWYAAVAASAVMGFPLLVRSARLAIELVDPRLEQAAATLGASRWRTLFSVTLPLAWPGILTGLTLCFARSLGEFGATITLAGNIPGQTRTLPLALFTQTQIPGAEGPAVRLMVISVLLSFSALLISELIARRTRLRLRQPEGRTS